MVKFKGGTRDLPTGGAELAKKCSFRTSFYQIFSNTNPKFPPAGGLGVSDRGAVVPSSLPLALPLVKFSPGRSNYVRGTALLLAGNCLCVDIISQISLRGSPCTGEIHSLSED